MKKTTRSIMAQTQWKVMSHHVTERGGQGRRGSHAGATLPSSAGGPQGCPGLSVLRGGWGRVWSFPWARPKPCAHIL